MLLPVRKRTILAWFKSRCPGLKSKFKEFQSLICSTLYLALRSRYDSRTSRRARSILDLVPGHFLRPSANASPRLAEASGKLG